MTGGGGKGPKIELNPKLKIDTDLGQFYGGPQVQSEILNNPVQKNIYQHKNIYFSTKNIYSSTKKYISIQKYLFQYQNIYFNPKIFISVQKKFSKKYKHIPNVFATRRQKRRWRI